MKKTQTRADLLLSMYPEELLDIWFGDDEEKRQEFGRWLVKQEELNCDDSLSSLSDNEDYYKKKIMKERSKPHNSIRSIEMSFFEINLIKNAKKKDKKKIKKIRNRDLSMATYLNSDKYKKSYLNNDEYRKSLKKICKQEKAENKTMRKLGYIKSKNADDELAKLLEKSNQVEMALSDAYIQKHFL